MMAGLLKFESLADDPLAIPDGDTLLRKVGWGHLGGRDRFLAGETPELSGNAFSDFPSDRAREYGYPRPCMSVHSLAKLRADGKEPTSLIDGYPEYGIAGIPVAALRVLARSNGDPCHHGVMWAPEPDDPAHAVVFHLEDRPRSKAEKRAIADLASWLVPLIA